MLLPKVSTTTASSVTTHGPEFSMESPILSKEEPLIMRSKMRRMLAVMTAVVMLMAALPMGGMVVSAAAPIVDENFESGAVYFSSNCPLEVIQDGSKVLHWDASKADWANIYKGINISANTDYVVTFKMKSNLSSAISIKFVQHDWATVDAHETVVPSSSWTEYSVVLRSKMQTSLLFMFQTNVYAASGQQIYLDDVVLTEKVEEPEVPSGDNMIINGDFETGDHTGWQKHQSTVISADAAHGGSYGANIKGDGGWGGMLDQTISVTANKNYLVTMWVKVNSNGVNIQLLNGPSGNKDNLGGGWFTGTTWTLLSYTVKPTQGYFTINFCGGGNGVAEDVYVDDIYVTEAPICVNGDFEKGDFTGWTKSQSTVVSTAAAYEGNYGAHLKGNGSWGGLLDQSINVEAGKTYELSFWLKINKTGVALNIKDGGSSGTKIAGERYSQSNFTSWKKVSYTVTPTTNVLFLNFCGMGGSGSANSAAEEDAYLDNVSVVKQKDPSFDGYMYNGDFEIGKLTPWNAHYSTVVDADSAYKSNFGAHLIGEGTWGGLMDQTVSVEAGKTYVLSFWLKILKMGVNIQFKDQNSGGSVISGGQWFDGAKYTDWTFVTLQFTAVSNKVFINFCGAGTSGTPDANKAEEAYVDNVSVVELRDPSYDGYVYDGDFEAGILIDWKPYQDTTLSADAAHSGDYGVHLIGAGGWGSTLTQDINTIVGLTYEWTFWVKALETGNNFKVENSSGDTLGSDYIDVEKASDWTKWTITFKATSSTTKLNICGSGKKEDGGADVPESLYLDDVTVAPKMEDIVSGGLTSISEDVSGLQFKFDVMAAGVQVNDNQFIADSGNVKPYYGYNGDYTLVGMGAVVTNKSDVGGSVDTMVLESVDDLGKVINIPVVYLYDYTDTAVSFAVRITDIPASKYDALIYVRAYFVFENAQGDQITVYDSEIYKQSYNGATA